MAERIRVIARVRAREGREAELRALLHALVAPTRVEAGCLSYVLLEQRDAPGTFAFVEEWESEAHLDAHLSSVHINEAVAGLGDLAVAPPEILRYRLVA